MEEEEDQLDCISLITITLQQAAQLLEVCGPAANARQAGAAGSSETPPGVSRGDAASQPAAAGGGGAAGADDVRGHLLGLMVTAAKHARRLAEELEAMPLHHGGEQEQQTPVGAWASKLVDARRATGLLHSCLVALWPVLQEERRAGGSSGGGGSGSSGGSGVGGCPCCGSSSPALAEAASFGLRCGFALASQMLHHLAHHLWTAQGSSGGRQGAAGAALPADEATHVAEAGAYMMDVVSAFAGSSCFAWRQLLAAQPQRLAAACCEVLAAAASAGAKAGAGGDPDRYGPLTLVAFVRLAQAVGRSVLKLAALEDLRPYVRAWLAPRAVAESMDEEGRRGGGGSGDGGGDGGGATAVAAAAYSAELLAGGGAGWSEGVVDDEAMAVMVGSMPFYGGLLHRVRQAAATGSGAQGESGGDGDRAYDEAVAAAARQLEDRSSMLVSILLGQPGPESMQGAREQLRRTRRQAGSGGGGVAGPKAALPPALGGDAIKAMCQRVRVCGNPACGNFARCAEAQLTLQRCGGCVRVRYCGADCQRAHWRGAHKEECKELQKRQQQQD